MLQWIANYIATLPLAAAIVIPLVIIALWIVCLAIKTDNEVNLQ